MAIAYCAQEVDLARWRMGQFFLYVQLRLGEALTMALATNYILAAEKDNIF